MLAILLFGLAVVFLVFLGWLLRGAGLWGDLAFAILVTTGVFWIARRVAHEWLDNERALKSFLRAFSTTILVLVGIPVACVTRPVGVVLLLLPTIVWAGFKIATRLGVGHRWRPVFWQAEVAGVAFLTIVLFVAPSVGSPDRVPRAVPAAATEGGEQDLAVAERFRPLLFFDSGEQRFRSTSRMPSTTTGCGSAGRRSATTTATSSQARSRSTQTWTTSCSTRTPAPRAAATQGARSTTT